MRDDRQRAPLIGVAIGLAICAADVPKHAIDVFRLSLPQHFIDVPWAGWLGAVACIPLVSAARHARQPVVGWQHVAFAAILGLWAVQELLQSTLGRAPDTTMILAFLPALVVGIGSRLLLDHAGDAAIIVRLFVAVALGVGGIHLALLLGIQLGLPLPFINNRETIDRNSVSYLLTFAVYLCLLRRDAVGPTATTLAFALATVHALANHARGAGLVLAFLFLFGLWRARTRAAPHLRRAELWAILPVMVLGAGAGALVDALGWVELLGSGDAALSTSYRSGANALTLHLFADNPWLGSGMSGVMGTRAGGYVSHTLYLVIPAAYGLLGVLPLLAVFRLDWRTRDAAGRAARSAALLFVSVVATFVNDPLPWLGLLFALDAVPATPTPVPRASP